jgi:hypothetical protein
MVIRAKQMEAIERARDLEYQQQLMAFYRDRAPQFTNRFSDAELRNRIAEAVPRARAFGLTSAEGIMQYVGLALASGPAFDEDPQVHKLMTLPGSTPEVKLKRLLQLVVRDLNEPGGIAS